MQAKTIVSKTLTQILPVMHAVRREALYAAVRSGLTGNAVAVTSLGRGVCSVSAEKHRIKPMDRVLSNTHLQGERLAIYMAVARQLIGGCGLLDQA